MWVSDPTQSQDRRGAVEASGGRGCCDEREARRGEGRRALAPISESSP
jgi:hypothetical protein